MSAPLLSRARLGPGGIAAGLVLALVAQRLAPTPAPLYDGVVVVEPYRYLSPRAGQNGNPGSAKASQPVSGATSPVVAAATTEQPPQAQVFAAPGGLVLPSGTTSISISIIPVPPDAPPPADGTIAGNVYRILLANQAGVPITAQPGAQVTIVLRGPTGLTGARIERFAGGRWTALQTSDAGLAATFLTTLTDFGDFALVGGTASVSPGGPSSTQPPAASSSLRPQGTPGSSPGATVMPTAAPASTEPGSFPLDAGVAMWLIGGVIALFLAARVVRALASARGRRP